MIPEKPSSLKSAVDPSLRFGRMVRLGSMASGVAGNMLIAGAQQLSQMRGAAMKVGQLISMDAGDVVPPEIAAILGRLRSSAHSMPDRQKALRHHHFNVTKAEAETKVQPSAMADDVRRVALALVGNGLLYSHGRICSEMVELT